MSLAHPQLRFWLPRKLKAASVRITKNFVSCNHATHEWSRSKQGRDAHNRGVMLITGA